MPGKDGDLLFNQLPSIHEAQPFLVVSFFEAGSGVLDRAFAQVRNCLPRFVSHQAER